ncbi:hypothetical protein Anapl_02807 [Anas platyrhynchos]|uniref:Uncharacterized protein n=1 Tax=Anas platyrhynchos TaxID=8839 RepID=R0LVX4_ANAPL|nr:hypothetical protein Anapl_02807 [Anas platyrhynchos]
MSIQELGASHQLATMTSEPWKEEAGWCWGSGLELPRVGTRWERGVRAAQPARVMAGGWQPCWQEAPNKHFALAPLQECFGRVSACPSISAHRHETQTDSLSYYKRKIIYVSLAKLTQSEHQNQGKERSFEFEHRCKACSEKGALQCMALQQELTEKKAVTGLIHLNLSSAPFESEFRQNKVTRPEIQGASFHCLSQATEHTGHPHSASYTAQTTKAPLHGALVQSSSRQCRAYRKGADPPCGQRERGEDSPEYDAEGREFSTKGLNNLSKIPPDSSILRNVQEPVCQQGRPSLCGHLHPLASSHTQALLLLPHPQKKLHDCHKGRAGVQAAFGLIHLRLYRYTFSKSGSTLPPVFATPIKQICSSYLAIIATMLRARKMVLCNMSIPRIIREQSTSAEWPLGLTPPPPGFRWFTPSCSPAQSPYGNIHTPAVSPCGDTGRVTAKEGALLSAVHPEVLMWKSTQQKNSTQNPTLGYITASATVLKLVSTESASESYGLHVKTYPELKYGVYHKATPQRCCGFGLCLVTTGYPQLLFILPPGAQFYTAPQSLKEGRNSDLKMEVNGHDLAAEDTVQSSQPSLTLLRPRLKNTKVSDLSSRTAEQARVMDLHGSQPRSDRESNPSGLAARGAAPPVPGPPEAGSAQ